MILNHVKEKCMGNEWWVVVYQIVENPKASFDTTLNKVVGTGFFFKILTNSA